ncbi:hypothetical protein J6Y50_01835 [bacterium]|nr:hypothetical protein [bacterium]
MSKLYVFAIGGSGARVFDQFIMMLASGVKLGNFNEVHPILIDLDTEHPVHTKDLCEKYLAIYEQYRDTRNEGSFFGTKIVKTKYNVDGQEQESFIFPLKINNSQEQFKEYIKLRTLDEESSTLASVLFSDDNFNTNLFQGCKGQPNIGSVIFSNEYLDTTISEALFGFQDHEDRVLVISSCFGGTGAAGFPALVKKISEQHPNHFIGSVSIQPYFNFNSVSIAAFSTRVQVSLDYYSKHILDSRLLYWVGDNKSYLENNYTYEQGGGAQVDADLSHLAEFVAAAAIVDFAKIDRDSVDDQIRLNSTTIPELNRKSRHYIYEGVKGNNDKLNFKNVFNDPSELDVDIRQRTSAFYLFTCFLKNAKKAAPHLFADNQLWVSRFKISDNTLKDLKSYCHSCTKNCWQIFNEMQDRKQEFQPFKECNKNDPMDVRVDIRGKKLSAGGFLGFWKKAGYDYILKCLNKRVYKRTAKDPLDLFSKVFNGIITKKYGEQ